MIKKLVAFILVLNCALGYAQTIKTDVLVVGGNASGVASAIQCARSKVKTLLVEPAPSLCGNLTGNKMITLETCRNLPSGIWGEFRKRVIGHYRATPHYDTTYSAPLQFEPDTAAAILAKIADTVKNLSIKLNTTFTTIKKDGDRWEVAATQNGKTIQIKARVVIDATEAGVLIQKAGATLNSLDAHADMNGSNLYRTSIAPGDGFLPANNYPAYYIPMKAVIAADNLLVTEKLLPAGSNVQYLPVSLTLGQGAGVVAAYCAFFKTTTANLNVRMIQGELLDFKGYMLPLVDIGGDPYWRAIQQVCATGMLKGVQRTENNHAQLFFMPESVVETAEVKPVLLEIYTRAFLWFGKEKPGRQFTVGNLLSFISELTLTDPENLQKSITKNWNTQYGLTLPFDMGRPVTRREFAILANKFLNPFGRTVDLSGRIIN